MVVDEAEIGYNRCPGVTRNYQIKNTNTSEPMS